MLVAVAASAALLIAAATPLMADAHTQGTQNPQLQRSRLEMTKLREEIRKLEIENDQAEGFTNDVVRWGPFLTVALGAVGLYFGVRKEVRDNRRQRDVEIAQRQAELKRSAEQADLDRNQRETELKQQQAETQRRFDELFVQSVANLGSDKESVQLSAVVVLESALRAEDEAFQEQVYSVVVANLAIEHPPLVNRFLVRAFEKAIRLRLTSRTDGELAFDLANCKMPRVDLRGLCLENADFAYATLLDANLVGATLTNIQGYDVDLGRARLSKAILTGARLHGARCRETQFHNATLVDVKLRASNAGNADLRGAEFYGAKMQGAHLEDANVTGARFDDANLSDAYFIGARFDDDTLRSVLRAAVVKGEPTWRSAHFDAEGQSRLEVLATTKRRSRHRGAVDLEPGNQPATP